ncbi:hypothetical protein [Natrinema amylolyticum]|uniref:hypothetical protein n=1 Tax=Natrinema amylolyticum TaxID=2878679 RepID=UPI001CFAC920|nr:hypothetical protein [Natrinema amylolyticum]
MRENPSRRTVLKSAVATGAVATGIGAIGGQAAAQQDADITVDASDLQITPQRGQQRAAGLINVQVQNLAIQDVLEVTIAGIAVNIQNVNILSDNVVNINVSDAVDIEGNQVQVAVTVLGETVQGAEQTVTGTDTIDVQQTGQTGN